MEFGVGTFVFVSAAPENCKPRYARRSDADDQSPEPSHGGVEHGDIAAQIHTTADTAVEGATPPRSSGATAVACADSVASANAVIWAVSSDRGRSNECRREFIS
jgi:hypothetical protein